MEHQKDYLLEMIDMDKSFPGVRALDKVQFRLRAGTIHSLMGENGAGKSTLMKCLFGIYKKDGGSVFIEGEEVNFNNPKHALDSGVAMVHQELNQVLHRNVMENVWLGRLPIKKYGLVDTKKMIRDTNEIFKELEIDISPTAIIGTLSVSQRQM
ncbi:MAG: sugar ABC transporter ATP-binding protein, partial [Spirochaetales bacterium]|nr:sugar ABC transporter ATP-binding protein [Spirochaetales bacterium]